MITKHQKFWGYLVLVLLVSDGRCVTRSQSIELIQVVYQHNEGTQDSAALQKKQSHIEIGHIIFYFSQEPSATAPVEKKQGHMRSIVMFFPQTTLAIPPAQQQIKQTDNRGLLYQVSLEVVDKPSPGVRCTITYDDRRVISEADFFHPIKKPSGFIIRFYNKELLHTIKSTDNNLLRMVCNKVPGIVIDCGHGGHDPGARSSTGIQEKDITLDIGLVVAQLLREEGFNVFLTRDGDADSSIENRIMVAKASNASLMLSIHADAAVNKLARGIGVFCSHPSLFRNYFNGVEFEFAKPIENFKQDFFDQCKMLASDIYRHIFESVKINNPAVRSRSVRYAVAQLFLGVDIPIVLIELGFLSNEDEARMLSCKSYQNAAARGIAAGIINYLARTSVAC